MASFGVANGHSGGSGLGGEDDDPLSLPNYSPVDHLNVLFPTSANVQRVGDIRDLAQLYGQSLESKLINGRRTSGSTGSSSIEAVSKTLEEVRSLTDQIDSLRTQAASTDQAITAMTLDIKKLDNTKANLIQSITVLKRLQMLTTAYNQLSSLVARRQYKEMSQTLPAVMELMAHFRQFRSISQIATLSKQVSDIQVRISDQIFDDFATVIEHKPGSRTVAGSAGVSGTGTPVLNGSSTGFSGSGAGSGTGSATQTGAPASIVDISATLADACVVLDSLPGSTARDRLISWFCNVQLKEYRTIFRSSDEAGSLENISRRYSYLKRLLKTHSDEYARYFVPSWNVTEELCKRFCATTREDIQGLLSQVSSTQTNPKESDVQLLLNSLNETLEFEQYLEKKFKYMNPRPASSSSTSSSEPFKFANSVSIAFQPHLNIWIQFQDRALAQKFQEFRAVSRHSQSQGTRSQTGSDDNDQENKDDDDPTVLPSSADLFIFYRSVLTQTAKLSNREPLLQLSNLFGKWLTVYCSQILRSYIPDRLVTTDDIKTICLVITTADYCFNTTNQLEQKLVDQLDPEFKVGVDLEREKGMFLEVINLCIRNLVRKVEAGCEFAWREMANTNWSKVETVGDQSSYVADLTSNIERDTLAILECMKKETHARMLCDKIVEAVTGDFLQSVVRCRPISEVSAEQMLLDLYVLKGCFLKLPTLAQKQHDHGSMDINGTDKSSTGIHNNDSGTTNGLTTGSETSTVSSAYTRHVTKSLSRVETILKVILTQVNPAEGLVQNYFYLVGDKSQQNFAKILELKGITRGGQTRFLEMFNAHLKAHDNLVDESPILSSLQLNPLVGKGTVVGGSRVSSASHINIGIGGLGGAAGIMGSGSGINLVGSNNSSNNNSGSSSGNPFQNGSHLFDTKGPSILSKEGFERFTHGAEAPVNKLNENFRNFGRLFRRDGSGSPLGNRNNH
ncbi:Vps53p [Sugiyamaella lignohabitans]|uniref:Vps53p n=1 Tax=Sugiyamaella lignohabitans TaxID=796027 RepID=A0A167EBN4_9ASCO|nr:Vps53p [Sugiyamaella lignohabitans]ANB13876.1 Vps53p [Sugiyamaella lignohabitans]